MTLTDCHSMVSPEFRWKLVAVRSVFHQFPRFDAVLKCFRELEGVQ